MKEMAVNHELRFSCLEGFHVESLPVWEGILASMRWIK